MLEIGTKTVLHVADGVVMKSFPEANQYYAFNTITGDNFDLNHTAFWVLNSLTDAVVLSELETEYVETFGVRRALGAKHLKELIAILLENALIKEVTP